MAKIFSFGGGVQSNAALVLAAQQKIDYQTFVFCNVGAKSENPETLDYVETVSKPFAKQHGLELIELFKTDSDGNPVDLFDLLHQPSRGIYIPARLSGGVPARRNCTADFKVETAEKYRKANGFTMTGLGISIDEISRAKVKPGIEYPLRVCHLVPKVAARSVLICRFLADWNN